MNMNHEIKVSLIISGFEESPDKITEIIGLTPTKKWLKGELIDPRATIRYKENGWKLSSGVSDKKAFKDHIKSLIGEINLRIEPFSSICQKYKGKLFCAIYLSEKSGDSLPEIHFEKSDIIFFANIGIELDLDLYIIP